MNVKYAQQGIGLVEVLISLLLLAVAALGYSALQVQSLGETDESLTRTQAITLLHTAAEKIRVNGVDNVFNQTVTVASTPSTPGGGTTVTITGILAFYATEMNKELSALSLTDCKTTACTPQQMATNDVIALKTRAQALNMELGMTACPGTINPNGRVRSYCLIAAWNGTTPTLGSNPKTDCLAADGAYHPPANCIYMEAY